jgi:hypothetical protein
MKRISFFVVIINAVITCSLSSCNKDELTPSINGSQVNEAPAPAPFTIDLVADKWNKIMPGIYSCSFKNIIPPGYRNHRSMKVYLLKADQKIQIDDPINFMGGELSAITTTTDVTINYRCYTKLPFEYLQIKVEIG